MTAETALCIQTHLIPPEFAPFVYKRSGLDCLDRVSRLDVQDVVVLPDQLLQLAGPAVERRERAEVHRHDRLHSQELDCLGCALRAHRVEIADWQKRGVELVE